MKKICIIVEGYPTPDDPVFAFIQPVAAGIADAGIECTVLCAQSITKAFVSKKALRPYRWIDKTERGGCITVIQPKTISFSTLTPKLNSFFSMLACRAAARKNRIAPDVVYGHFWHSGVLGTSIFPGIPTIVANGESKIWVERVWPKSKIEKAKKQIKGVISVSTKSRDESEACGLLSEKPASIVLPNGVDEKEFYHMDKREARKELGISDDEKIAAFVGSFIERKGVQRVVDAANRIPELKLMLVGAGNVELKDESKAVFIGRLPHNKIAAYLNAADMFVLPTLAEGCCNAIVEALACGLPVISSDLDFNYDVLNDENSILIDPMNIDQIELAIRRLMDNDDLRSRLGAGALTTAQTLKIEKRVEKIIQFIAQCCK